MMQAFLWQDARKIFDCSENYLETEKTNNDYLCSARLLPAVAREKTISINIITDKNFNSVQTHDFKNVKCIWISEKSTISSSHT